MWGLSSVGRAPALQAGCRRFDSVRLHQTPIRRLIWEGADHHRIATHSIAVEVIIKEERKVFDPTNLVVGSPRSTIVLAGTSRISV